MSLLTRVVKSHAPLLRMVLYSLLGLWSLLLFIFSVVRLVYTSTLTSDSPLNGGLPFYDSPTIELLVCSVLGFGFSIFMLMAMHFRRESKYFSRNWFEVGFLFLLWMLWLGGACAANSIWPELELDLCAIYSPCQVLRALMGWAWLGWLCLTFLFIPTLWIIAAARNWNDDFFNTWGFDRSVHIPIKKGGRPVPDTGPDIGLPVMVVTEAPREKSGQGQVEREVRAREEVWNFDKEAAKMRGRLNSWIGHRRQSREARAAAGGDLEHGGSYLYGRQGHHGKKPKSNNLVPPVPPLPSNGVLGLTVEGVAVAAP